MKNSNRPIKGQRDAASDGRQPRGRRRNQRPSPELQEDALDDKLVGIQRVSKVVRGGRIMSFRALTVVGDGDGRVGYGIGKAREVPRAIAKATERAKRNMIRVPLKNGTLQYTIRGRHDQSKVLMQPAAEGTGIIAGGAMRAVLELVGVSDVLAKCFGSTNPINVVRATVDALGGMETPEDVAKRRGLKPSTVRE